MKRYYLLLAVCLLAVAAPTWARPLDPDVEWTLPRAFNSNHNALLQASTAAPGDTVWFGGTVWAADSARWEAVEGGMWTFDSGIGSHFDHDLIGGPPKDPSLHAQMEGWIGHLFTLPKVNDTYFRRVGESDFGGSPVCVGDAGGLGGDYSLYAGVLPHEAVSLFYASGGGGYGNDWNMSMRKEFFYPGSGAVTLEFDYVNETEPGYDITWVVVDTSGTGDEVTIETYDGEMSGHASIVLMPGSTLPTAPSMIAIRFEVFSDSYASDEDGVNATDCGAFAVDDIVLSGAITAGPMTFETDDEGWVLVPGTGRRKDWSNIVALADLPPLQVPSCGLADSVLVFENLDPPGAHNGQTAVAVSPWIDLHRAGVHGRRGKVLELDMYTEVQRNDAVAALPGVQWSPCIDPVFYTQGTSPVTTNEVIVAYVATECVRIQIDLSHAVPLEAKQVRVAVGLSRGGCTTDPCSGVTSPPWFDNVRLGVYGDPKSVPSSPEAPPAFISSWSTLLPGDSATEPGDVAVDSSGRLYIVDVENDRIQKHHPEGAPLASWGQQGSGPGEFNFLSSTDGAVAVSPDWFVYVADLADRIQKFTSNGVFLLQWGSTGTGDGEFLDPTGIAVDDLGFIYVADIASGGRIQKFAPDTTFVGSWTVGGLADIDVVGDRVYAMADEFYDPVLSVFTTEGLQLESWGFSSNAIFNPGGIATNCAGYFFVPRGITANAAGDVFLTDDLQAPEGDRILKFTPEGGFLAGWNAAPPTSAFRGVMGIALSPNEARVYAVDGNEGVVKIYSAATTGVGDDQPIPVTILSAYPNPFSAQTRLELTLLAPEEGGKGQYHVEAKVFDLRGRLVRTVHRGSLRPGNVSFLWDGRGEDGSRSASGIYFFRVRVDGQPVKAKKIVRLH